jgi:ferric-dicitrate binding protein FerR (iron transport regulator)
MLSLTLSLLLTAAPAELTVGVKPEGVKVEVDGTRHSVKEGQVKLKVKAGKHLVRLSFNGDAHTEEVELKAGEKKTWSWSFEETKSGTMPTDDSPTPSVE